MLGKKKINCYKKLNKNQTEKMIEKRVDESCKPESFPWSQNWRFIFDGNVEDGFVQWPIWLVSKACKNHKQIICSLEFEDEIYTNQDKTIEFRLN